MGTWAKIDPNQLIPASVVSAITALADLITGALELPAALSIPSLPSLGGPNPVVAVVNALLNTIESLLKAGRIHTLTIPIAKVIPQPLPPPLPPTIPDLEAALQISLGPPNTAAANAYADMLRRSGGNAGFYNAFATSLMDFADTNRPQYEAQHDAVVMATLLVGAPSFAAITAAASTLDLLTRPKAGMSLTARTLPVPQNLSAKIVGAAAKPGIGVRMDWDAPPSSITRLYFPGIKFTVKRYAVIRSTSKKAPSATSVLDFFTTQTLTEGLEQGDHKVVAIGSGKNSAYLDVNAKLDPNTPYYYCIAWETDVDEGGKVTTLPFDKVSNVVKVEAKKPTVQQTGQSPDWVATESAMAAFPDLQKAALRMIEETRVLLKPSESPADKITAAVKLASSAAKRVAARSTELIDDVKRLSSALSRPIPSLYVTRMVSASGGNAFLMAELAKRLNDVTDPTRPAFDNGEYVCGVCFVAGAPRLADLSAIIAFFESLFGPAAPTNPLLGVLEAIDTLVTQAEAVVFDPGMKPIAPGTVVPEVTATPVVSAAGIPVTTDSPDNPNQGDTNVTLVKDLC